MRVDENMVQTIAPASLGLAAIYLILTPAHLIVVSGPMGQLLSMVAAFGALTTLVLGLRWRRAPPRAAAAPALFTGLAAFSLWVVSLHLYVDPDPRHTTNFAALLVGIGLFQLDRRWLIGSIAGVWLAWGGIVMVSPPDASWGHYFFLLVLATALAGAAHAARVGNLRRLDASAAELSRSEERFRSLADSAPDAIVAIDTASIVQFANPAIARVLGWAPDDIIGRPLEEVIPPESREAHRAAIARYVATGERRISWQNVRLDAMHLSGRLVPVEVSFDEWTDGAERRFIGFIRDVTRREEIERERREIEQRMQETQRLESLGLLAGGIAHDFNNLLAPIVGDASILVDAERYDPGAARDILDAAVRAAHLTQQLLAYAGRAPDRRMSLDVSDEAGRLSRLIATSLPGASRIEVDLATDLPRVDIDPGQLQQVVVNLIRNADDASDAGSPIHVRTAIEHLDSAEASELLPRTERPGGDYVLFEVRDEGVGIPEAHRARIFDPFFSTKSASRGLGLSAVLGIAGASGGGLTVESRERKGTTMRLLLPAGAPPARLSREVETIDRRADAESRRSRGKALVIDDERALRRVARRMLESLDYEVVEADCGEDALERLDQLGELRLVVLDLSMPGIGGSETLERLRRRRPDLPVLLSSGYDASDDRATGHGLPGVGFLQKPYRIDDLTEALDALLGGASTDPM